MTIRHRDNKYFFFKKAVTGLVLIVSFWFIFFKLPIIFSSIALAIILLEMLIIEWPRFFNITSSSFWLLMPLYPITPMIMAIIINQHPVQRGLILFMVILVAAFDFGGYAFGSLFGKNKIAPSISPRKSWEGVLGGLIFFQIALAIMLNLNNAHVSIMLRIYLSMIICFLALLGDMVESFLKRRVGIKDSGSFLPGHGGFFDRLDALMFVTPFFFLLRAYLTNLFGL